MTLRSYTRDTGLLAVRIDATDQFNEHLEDEEAAGGHQKARRCPTLSSQACGGGESTS